MANSRMSFQSLWLQRMPPHIQTVLSASSEPLDKLAIIADKVSEVVGASSTICAAKTVPPPSQSSSCSAQPTMDSLARQIQELFSTRVSIEEVGSATIIAVIKSRPASVSPCAFVQKNEPQQPFLISKSASHGTVHHIITTGPPVTARPRRLHPKLYDAVKLDLVGDYRQLNSVTEFDSYPMPYLNDFAHALHGKRIFSKIDIFKAFQQIPIAECDIPKTAVTTPWGLYEYSPFVFWPCECTTNLYDSCMKY
ncbi:retrovirus-related Pol polyprotein from transposon opus [Trichonephila clavipes]|nr:retrovirus-related Pol polyprotein from transposon opus [Trichonephila clavipes]